MMFKANVLCEFFLFSFLLIINIIEIFAIFFEKKVEEKFGQFENR